MLAAAGAVLLFWGGAVVAATAWGGCDVSEQPRWQFGSTKERLVLAICRGLACATLHLTRPPKTAVANPGHSPRLFCCELRVVAVFVSGNRAAEVLLPLSVPRALLHSDEPASSSHRSPL